MCDIYARVINQKKFIFQAVFSTRFDKQDEDDQVLNGIELFINLTFHQNLT